VDKRQLNDLRIATGNSDLSYAVEQNRVDTYNQSQGDDDKTGIQCDLCNNRGNIAFISDEGRFKIRSCKCSGTRLTVSRLQKQGLFEASKMKTLDSFWAETETQKALKSLAQKYIVEKEPKWMLLCGQSGAGKTHLCTAAFVQLSFDRGIDGRYLLWNSDGRRIKAAAREGDEQLLNDFKKCSLLYIDDLFKCKRDTEPSDADVRLAFEILDYRYRHKLRTIISTEMLLEDLYHLDEAIFRRIYEMCGPHIGNIGRDPSKCYIP
jgi:DNA replication protein DnaC